MKNKITIGTTDDSTPVEIELSTLIDTRLLIQANSGGGKSWALRKLLEQSHGQVQQIVLDLEGEFSTLREKYDYVLIGKEGDIPINIKVAELLARKLLELNSSAIIDLYELKAHERILFVKRFLDSMINAPKKLWHPCIVVVDEAHIFCPEKGKAESMASVIDLCTRGRKRGYCAVLATQRLSKLHKDAAAECNNKLIGRTGLDIDMKRAGEELGFTSKNQLLSLRDLMPGEFFAFGPSISRSIISCKINKVATTHPRAGSRELTVSPPATDKVKTLLSKLGDLPKAADEELRTVQDFKQKIRELKFELRAKPKPEADKNALHNSYQQGFKDGKKVEFEELGKASDRNIRYHGYLERIEKVIGSWREKKPSDSPVRPVIKFDKPRPITFTKNPSPVVPVDMIHPGEDNIPLRAGAMKMLKVAAMFFSSGGVSKQQIATMSGFSVKGGTFNTYLSELKRNGWLIEQFDKLFTTEEGFKSAGDVPDLPSDSQEIIQMWARKFRAGASKMLRVIAEVYPEGLSKEELGERTGFVSSGGTFNTYLSELRRNDLIEIEGQTIKATKELFLEG